MFQIEFYTKLDSTTFICEAETEVKGNALFAFGRREALKRGYDAYRIMQGQHFISPLIPV